MKKLLLSLGTLAAIAAPLATIISCGDSPKKDAGNPAKTNGNANPEMPSTTGIPVVPARTQTANKGVDQTVINEKSIIDTRVDETVIPKNSVLDIVPKSLIDRSGKVLSTSKDVSWNIEEQVVRGAPARTIKANVYHTALFDYVVQEGFTYENCVITSKTIERLAKVFEANTVIGVGHYSYLDRSKNKSIVKNEPIQFLSGTSWQSFGGVDGVSMITQPLTDVSTASDESLIDQEKIINEGSLMMHEYGHHETMIGPVSLPGAKDGMNIFQRFSDDVKADPSLSKYAKFFDTNTGSTGAQETLGSQWDSPWGKVDKDVMSWNRSEYGYVFSPAEFVTRFLSLMETGINPSEYITIGGNFLGKLDSLAMHKAFGENPYENDQVLNKLVDLYKKDVFVFDQNLGGNKNSIGYVDTKGKGPSLEISFKLSSQQPGWLTGYLDDTSLSDPEKLAVKNWATVDGKVAKLKVTKESFDEYPVEYRINKSIKNGVYDLETIKGTYYRLKPDADFGADNDLGRGLAKIAADKSVGVRLTIYSFQG